MVALGQTAKIAELMREGWMRAPSKRLLIEHRLGEPVLMVRGLQFVLVMSSGEVIPATFKDIAEW